MDGPRDFRSPTGPGLAGSSAATTTTAAATSSSTTTLSAQQATCSHLEHISLDIFYLHEDCCGGYRCDSSCANAAASRQDQQHQQHQQHQVRISSVNSDYASSPAAPRAITSGSENSFYNSNYQMEQAQWGRTGATTSEERSTRATSGGGGETRTESQSRNYQQSQQQHSNLSPIFITHIQDYIEKKEGDSLHLECHLGPDVDPEAKTEWLFNGQPLVTGSRFHTTDDFGFVALDIDWLFPRDSGEYVCRASNKSGSQMTRTILRVKPDKSVELGTQLENPQVVDKLRQLDFPEAKPEPLVAREPGKPARFVQHLRIEGNRRQFNEGESVYSEARVAPASDGELTVEWYHNGRPLISGSRFKPSFEFGHIILNILQLCPEDSGIYKCVIRNGSGVDSSQFEIQVKGKPALEYHSQLPREMIAGHRRQTDLEAQWDKLSEVIDEERSLSSAERHQLPVEHQHHLRQQQELDAREAQHQFLSKQSQSEHEQQQQRQQLQQFETLQQDQYKHQQQLQFEHEQQHQQQQPAPRFLTHIQDYIEKKEGDSLHLECCLGPVDDPDLKTEWFFNGRPLVTGSRFHTIDDFGFIVLDIDWLFPRDTGEYVCKATNKHGSDLTRTVLRVKPDKNVELDSQLDNPEVIDKLRQLEFPDVKAEPQGPGEPDKPARFVQHLKTDSNKRQFTEGENVHFEARVAPATDGELTVEWFHNEQPLISGHRFKPTFDFGHIILDILYLYPEDSGVYKCVTRNAAGSDVSKFEIQVMGKPSLVYQSQLPKEMLGGVKKITEMEAQWNKPPEEVDEVEVKEKCAPQFVLKPKPYSAFEGSCARFCCRIMANPRPRITWVLNGQTVVSGSRYKLTQDGMYHLTIPKCQLSDAGKLEVYARNPLGECFATTELKVRKKVDDYRGVLKNSPNPWYDEQSLKVYQRHRGSQELSEGDDDEFNQQFQQMKLKLATEQQLSSPIGNQLIGYMEPGTPDVNLLLANSSTTTRTQSPLLEPGDLHPVVMEQQVVMAPAPSTIQRALNAKDSIPATAEKKSFQEAAAGGSGRSQVDQTVLASGEQEGGAASASGEQRRVFGLDSSRKSRPKAPSTGSSGAAASGFQQHQQQHQQTSWMSQLSPSVTGSINLNPNNQQRQQQWDQNLSQRQSQQQQQQQRQRVEKRQAAEFEERSSEVEMAASGRQSAASGADPRLPPPSPESKVHGKEVHLHTHKQIQLERHTNREIKREIIDKDIFEQEHSGTTKENLVRGDSLERRGSTPTSDASSALLNLTNQQQQQKQANKAWFNQQHQQQEFEQQQVVLEEHMFPPEFLAKIQPCRAVEGAEARFECSFKGDPKPSISWFRDDKLVKPSNLYTIVNDLQNDKSTLIIRRVQLNSNAVFMVKAENCAGSAKSSANLVVEPQASAGKAQQQQQLHASSSSFSVSGSSSAQQQQQQLLRLSGGLAGSSLATENDLSLDSSLSDSQASGSLKRVKSVKTRKLRMDELSSLARASPEGLVAPAFLHTIHDTTSKPGELVRLDARLIGSPPMDVIWLKDGERLRPDRGHKLVLEGDVYTLLILEAAARDEGFYECHAMNQVGEAYCGASLLISADGAGSGQQHQYESVSGRTSAASASSFSAAGGAGSRASSAQGGSFVTTTTRTTSSASGSASASQQKLAGSASEHFETELDPASGQRKHFGVQKHAYKNPLMDQYAKSADRSNNILSLIKGLDNQQVREGKSVTLRCQISSFPIAEVQWFKQANKLIKPSKYFRIYKDNDETYCLKILETFPEDQGEYRCVARAPNGKTNVETKANITVIPNSPK